MSETTFNGPAGPATRKYKVQRRDKLPKRMPVEEWLQITKVGSAGANRLGGLAMFNRQLCAVACIRSKVHVLPITQAVDGCAFATALQPDDAQALGEYRAQHAAGQYDAVIAAYRKQVDSIGF